jgi:hypothetical protein
MFTETLLRSPLIVITWFSPASTPHWLQWKCTKILLGGFRYDFTGSGAAPCRHFQQRLNMAVDLQSLFGLHVTWCAQLYSLAETPQFPLSPRIWAHIRGHYWSAKTTYLCNPLIFRSNRRWRVCYWSVFKLASYFIEARKNFDFYFLQQNTAQNFFENHLWIHRKCLFVSHQWCDLFYRLLHSSTRHIEEVEGGERDTLIVHRNKAAVAWPEAIACHRPRRQCDVIKAPPPP